jgi:hypothetical protein
MKMKLSRCRTEIFKRNGDVPELCCQHKTQNNLMEVGGCGLIVTALCFCKHLEPHSWKTSPRIYTGFHSGYNILKTNF